MMRSCTGRLAIQCWQWPAIFNFLENFDRMKARRVRLKILREDISLPKLAGSGSYCTA